MSLVSVIKHARCDVSKSRIDFVFCSRKRKVWDAFGKKKKRKEEKANKCLEPELLLVLALIFRPNKQSISLG